MTYDEENEYAPSGAEHGEPNNHRPSREAWKALARIEKHEAVCAERYKDIDRRLTGLHEDGRASRKLLMGIIALVIAALLAAFFDMAILRSDERRVIYVPSTDFSSNHTHPNGSNVPEIDPAFDMGVPR